MRKNHKLLLAVCICFMCACKTNFDTLIQSNPNLHSYYKEYKNCKQKKKSLSYLIKHSANSDLKLLHIDSLKSNIDLAHKIWETTSWAKQYEQNIFQEYILPMRVADEPLEYYWRSDAKVNTVVDLKDSDIRTIAKRINTP